MKKNIFKILTIIALILGITACSTEKNTSLSRFYHNTTLKYNIYFNGNESYKKGISKIYSQNTDNYALILNVFVDSKEDMASMASGEMERAIQKSSKGIKIHSITKKPNSSGKKMTKQEKEFMAQNEFNKWVDDSYLLLGKSYFIKRDYLQARQNLEYAIRQYPNSKIQPMANLYLARTFSEDKKFKNAKETLDKIEADKKITKKQVGLYAAVYADYYLKQNMREDAIPKLKMAVENTKKRRDKLRYAYILAQIYEKLNEINKASDYYAFAAKRNPSYEMEFNAKINMAKCYSGKGNNKEIFKILNKMLKDEKNLEYKDQIHFAIAEVEMRIGQEEKAIENYKKSVETSISNDYQKAISCLKLGEIYFNKLDYKNANTYYDTCILYLPENYDNYADIKSKAKNLSELVTFTNVIEFEDSVQKLAKMSDKERNKIIDGLIANVVEQERLERELAQQESMNSYLFDQRRGQTNTVGESSGKWYFYNPAQLSFGKNEFQKKWGTRKNEDHWRRRDKTMVAFDSFSGEENADSTATVQAKPRNEDPKNREYYLQDIPLTDSLMAESHKRIENAIFNASRIYKDKFADYKRSINSYESLNSRYPKTDYLLLSYYNLYILNTLVKNTAEANKYKNLIITRFGDTNYAKLLQNPNFVQEQEEIRKRNEQLYMDTYDSFMRGDWTVVQNNTQKFITENENSELIPNFDFLKTMCIARNADTTQFRQELLNFIDRYPEHELKTAAENILAYFGTADLDALIADLKSRPAVVNKTPSSVSGQTQELAEEIKYTFDENAEHYYIVYFKSEQVDDKRLAFEIRNFNIFNFNMRTFNVVTSTFNGQYSIISVRPFRNKRQATNYSKMIANSDDVFNKLKNVDYQIFVISAENLSLLQSSKNINSYLEFYRSNY